MKRVGKYELGRTLGEGTFGKVKFAKDTESGEHVAIKILEKSSILKQGMAEQINKEISIMKMIQHDYIVNLIDVLASATKIYMVLELVTGGELFYKLANEGRFPEDTARHYFQQLINGLAYCHSMGIYHRDLKPENILLNDQEDQLKISDFGLSALQEKDGNLLRTTCGTPNYVAPEVLSNSGYHGSTADVWSCGVILYVFLAGFLPFEDPSTEALFKKITRASFRFPPWFSDGAKSLIERILVPDPAERITLEEILADPWFLVDLPDSEPVPSVGHVDTVDQSDDSLSVVDIGGEDVEVVEDDDEPGPAKDVSKITNAFDLIGRSGVFDLTRMLERHPPDQIKRYTRFSSSTDPDVILELLQSILDTMPVSYHVQPKSYSIDVNAASSKGIINFTIQIYELSGSLYLVDFQKNKGDTLEFTRYYRTLYEKASDASLPVEGSDGEFGGPSGAPPPSAIPRKSKAKDKAKAKAKSKA
ncbi:CAMK/CAMKL/AMPK protein kinase [Thecamonas trahens ATCC 50062]|uniref:non-specific serine/threonine protein kinase n=1 Tax=Thecamonas trahens ATCC 50062 TaxID=461836 RepID=A0A0L0D754_THETB|nr:CAMK/CAMKL/AMPK protein kinase [Thecamonas trahens ATCC 50062]KNC48174.1 CAMK/CAMKL/AMPK protein kinase [Thecamonas trahens ATCC 50062]|eukprot:XP_013758744.1 CAMK/CAMKL/AMPK protein kinase [Thecamonas trahens ATCC 50062]